MNALNNNKRPLTKILKFNLSECLTKKNNSPTIVITKIKKKNIESKRK